MVLVDRCAELMMLESNMTLARPVAYGMALDSYMSDPSAFRAGMAWQGHWQGGEAKGQAAMAEVLEEEPGLAMDLWAVGRYAEEISAEAGGGVSPSKAYEIALDAYLDQPEDFRDMVVRPLLQLEKAGAGQGQGGQDAEQHQDHGHGHDHEQTTPAPATPAAEVRADTSSLCASYHKRGYQRGMSGSGRMQTIPGA
jgi:hypothetical protein